MLKYVPAQSVEDDHAFPYAHYGKNYSSELLHSVLFSPVWTIVPEDSDVEISPVMDYDGFLEWYASNIDEWMLDRSFGDYGKDSADEYLRDHLGVTMVVVKEAK